MKAKKRMISLLLVLALAVGICPAALAAETDAKTTELEESISPRYGEREVVTLLAVEETYADTEPQGQDPGGYRFPAPGGGELFVNDAKGPKVSVNLGVSWAIIDNVSVSVNTGIAGPLQAQIGGASVHVSGDGHYYKVRIRRHYIAKHIQIDYYKYNDLVDTAYFTRLEPNGTDYLLIRVN